MRILSLEADGYKNLEQVVMQPHPSLNLILGNNAQGKTNLLEAIWTCTGCKSFRGSKERDWIHVKKPAMHIKLQFEDSKRKQEIQYHMQRADGRQKKILLNQVSLQGGSRLFAQFQCVVFSPDDREIVRGGPEKRRAFMDLCGSQLNPAMLACIKRFDQLTAQRNAMLKQIALGRAAKSDLSVWDIQLAQYGAMLTCMRYSYIQQLAQQCAALYSEVTRQSEQLEIRYHSNLFSNTEIPSRPTAEMQQSYLEQLTAAVDDDIRQGFSTKGAGRDDFFCKINFMTVRDFGLQGQQKTTALVLKLAQASVFYAQREETPIILLDDVMGELDADRQRLVYHIIRDMQVFLTACHAESVGRETRSDADCSVFSMQQGVLHPMPQ